MSKSSSNSATSENDAAKKSLYQNFLAIREDVLRHKWLKSEEASEDIGFEAALVDWMKKQADKIKES